MDDELVFTAAEQFRDLDRFFAQEVADVMLESDVGGVLEALHHLVGQGRLVHLDRVTTPDASDDGAEFEGFRFPVEEATPPLESA